jgi:two-component system chemotaxis response regulator CheB
MIAQAAELEPDMGAAFANDREELLEMARRAVYDIVVVDCETVGRDVARCLEELAKELPEAEALVTMRPSKSNAALQREISANGAALCFVKPIYGSYAENLEAIRQKLKEMAALSRQKQARGERPRPARAGRAASRRLALVAASTGGQQALETVLPGISGDYPAPILVVLHMPAHSAAGVAASLDKKTALRVKLAQDCEQAEPGTVYLAPGGLHMALSAKGRIMLEDSAPINRLKPSADALFSSVANSGAWPEVLAVIMTGMGKDGAKGLAELKRKLNCICVAQSERTCTVYGMPKAAVDSGLADSVLDLGDIAHSVETFGFSPLPQGKTRL